MDATRPRKLRRIHCPSFAFLSHVGDERIPQVLGGTYAVYRKGSQTTCVDVGNRCSNRVGVWMGSCSTDEQTHPNQLPAGEQTYDA